MTTKELIGIPDKNYVYSEDSQFYSSKYEWDMNNRRVEWNKEILNDFTSISEARLIATKEERIRLLEKADKDDQSDTEIISFNKFFIGIVGLLLICLFLDFIMY